MLDPSTLFGWTVAILAGLAVVAVLVFIIVWAILGIRRLLVEHRARTMAPSFGRYWTEHQAVTIPESIVPPPAP
jgi:hypothetical protein